MGKFDLNTLRVDRNIFESGKKKLRIQKYLDTCGRGLKMRFCYQALFTSTRKGYVYTNVGRVALIF